MRCRVRPQGGQQGGGVFWAKETPDVLRNWTHMLFDEGGGGGESVSQCVCLCSLDGFSGLRVRGERVTPLTGQERR